MRTGDGRVLAEERGGDQAQLDLTGSRCSTHRFLLQSAPHLISASFLRSQTAASPAVSEEAEEVAAPHFSADLLPFPAKSRGLKAARTDIIQTLCPQRTQSRAWEEEEAQGAPGWCLVARALVFVATVSGDKDAGALKLWHLAHGFTASSMLYALSFRFSFMRLAAPNS